MAAEAPAIPEIEILMFSLRAWDKITASKNQEASPSFLKKRSKKLLSLSANIERQPRCLGNESFLVLFFKKELPSAALHQLFGLTPLGPEP